jgi:hypothetical protein
LLVSFIASLIALCQYMIAAGRTIARLQGGSRCIYAAGVLYGLYVVIGNALLPETSVVTVLSAVDVVCSAGTVVIVAASTARSRWRNHRAQS